jgi:hypothetical protein
LRNLLCLDNTDSVRLRFVDKGEDEASGIRLSSLDKGDGVESNVLSVLRKGKGLDKRLLLLDKGDEFGEEREAGDSGDFALPFPDLLLFEPFFPDLDIRLLLLINGEGLSLGEAAPCEEEPEPVDFGVAVLLELEPNFTL